MMRERERICEAPYHTEGCNGIGETKDHLTPKCIAKHVLGWSRKQIEDPANIQYLSKACHQEKDATTSVRFRLALRQKKGETITLEEYLQTIYAAQSRQNQKERP